MTTPTSDEAALAGLRILDLTQGIAGAIGAKLLADFGADVVKVEPLTGDPARALGPFPDDVPDIEKSAVFLAYNRNKRGITLDVFSPRGRALLDDLVARCDAVMCTYSVAELDELHLNHDDLATHNPAVVLTALTGWGLTGPYRDYATSEIVVDAFGHTMSSFGVADRPPLMLGGGLRSHYAGEFAGMATLAACISAERSGLGQTVDVSSVEVHLGSADRRSVFLLRHQYTGQVVRRPDLGVSGDRLTGGFQPCADGWLSVALRPQQLEAFARLIGAEHLIGSSELAAVLANPTPADVQALFLPPFSEWASSRTRAEIVGAAAELRLPITAVNRVGELLEDPHLDDREFWVDVTHPVAGQARYMGAPFRMSAGGYRQRRPAPLLAEHTSEVLQDWLGLSPTRIAELASADIVSVRADGPQVIASPARPPVSRATTSPRHAVDPTRDGLPLEGIRVIDMTAVWAGPSTAMMLGDLGAEVIRVESVQFFTAVTRGFWPRVPKDALGRLMVVQNNYVDFDPGPRPWNRFGGFNAMNRNKLSMTADLRRPEGVEIFKKLAAISDVVLDNYGFGVMARLGLGDEALRSVNPQLINISMPLFGNTGPYRMLGGMGSVVDAWSGFMALRGFPDLTPPEQQTTTHMDSTTGPSAVLATLAALRLRERTGAGQFVDFAQSENMLQAAGEYVLDFQWNGRHPDPLGNRSRWGAIQGCYACADPDSWVVLTVSSDDEWASLCEVLGRSDLRSAPELATPQGRHRRHDLVDAAITEWTSRRTPAAAMRALQSAGIAAAPVLDEAQAAADPHVQARGFLREATLPDAGTHLYAGPQWRPLGTPLSSSRPAPTLGQDNEYVYRELLGFSAEDYERLVQDHHIGTDYLPGTPPAFHG